MSGSQPVNAFTRASFSRVPSFVSDALTNRRPGSAATSFGIAVRSRISIVANGIFQA